MNMCGLFSHLAVGGHDVARRRHKVVASDLDQCAGPVLCLPRRPERTSQQDTARITPGEPRHAVVKCPRAGDLLFSEAVPDVARALRHAPDTSKPSMSS